MNISLDLKNALPFIGGEISAELREQALEALRPDA